jgi:hypothetical protein
MVTTADVGWSIGASKYATSSLMQANDVLIHIAPWRRLIAFAYPLFGPLVRSVILFICAPRIAIHGYCLSLNLAAESGEQNTR